MPELTSSIAERLAKRLLANSLAWARTLLICVGRRDSSLEATLADETLAYSLCLLEERMADGREASQFAEMVRMQCCRLVSERSWRMANRHRRLPPVPAGRDHSEFSHRYLVQTAPAKPGVGPTDKTFEEFCRATGVSSSVLYGRGENLATLVYYVVAHGCLSCRAALTRRQTAELLRATRECHAHTESFLSGWAAEMSSEPPVGYGVLASGETGRRISVTTG